MNTPAKKATLLALTGGVENIKASYQELLQFGATPLEAPQNVGDGICVAMVKDPWANPFGIIVNPHFGNTLQ